MLPQAADFAAEAEELAAFLATLPDAAWGRETRFKRWTVDDVVQHLHSGDLLGMASIESPEAFARVRGESQALRDAGMTRIQETRHRMGGLTGRRLLDRWRATAAELAARLGALEPSTRLAWSGPGMGARMFATARQMETWAHGQAVYDLMAASRPAHPRLRNIAEIGVRTYGWTFSNRGLPAPGPTPHVRLDAPGGGEWTWGDPDPANMVAGSALEFCQVVAQTRNVADTGLRTAGEAAQAWMAIAQCFAGPPEDPPAPGTRGT